MSTGEILSKDPKLENNLFSFFRDFNSFEDFVYSETGHYSFIKSGKYKWPGYIFDFRNLYNVNIKSVVDEIDSKISDKILPSFLILRQNNFTNKLDRLLSEKLIRPVETWFVMFKDLEGSDISLKHPEDFLITRVTENSSLVLWYDIISNVLFKNKNIPYDFFKLRLNDCRYTFYLGFYRNVPVSTCMFFMDSNLAGAYMGATLKEFRGRGFGKEIVVYGMKDALNSGCNFLTAQSARHEFPIWEKIGFSVNSTINIYWKLSF